MNTENENNVITLDPAPPVRLRKVRHSKIASLPHPVLDKLCHRLEDGQAAPEILTWVNALPEVRQMLERDFEGRPITPQNLSEWRTTGYMEWVRLHEVRDHVEWLHSHDLQMGEVVKDRMGERVARVYALELLAALREALDNTKTPLDRFEVLCRGLDQIKGLRQWDNQAARLVMQEERWQRERMDLDDVRAGKAKAAEAKRISDEEHARKLERQQAEVREVERMLIELEDDGFDVNKLNGHESLLKAYAAMQARKAGKKSPESGVQSPKSGKECVGISGESEEIAQNPEKSNQRFPLDGRAVESLNRKTDESEVLAPQGPQKSTKVGQSGGPQSESQKTEVGNQQLAHSSAVCRSQNSTDPGKPQLEARGSLSAEEAMKVAEALYIKAKKAGLRVPKSVELGALRAYLTGKEQMCFNHAKLRNETIQPPATDPRLDPNSPWYGLWKKLATLTSQKALLS